MVKLKTDFHLHTRDDRHDAIRHTARELIDRAAEQQFDALAISNHNTFTFSRELETYASDRGILLIPGIEQKIEGKHVLLLNAFPATEKIHTFPELRRAKADGLFVVAPHPFYKASHCLGRKLYEHLDLFDALEFSFFYSRFFNLNRAVVKLHREQNMPLIGNSDCHLLKYFGACHSIIEAEHASMEAIFDAIRAQQVQVVSAPLPFLRLGAILTEMSLNQFIGSVKNRLGAPVFVPGRTAKELSS